MRLSDILRFLEHVPGWSQIVQQIKSVISAILVVD